MSFLGKLILAIPLAIVTVLIFLFPLSAAIAYWLGVSLGAHPESPYFSGDFLLIVFSLYEVMMIGIFGYIIKTEQGLPELKRSNRLHQFSLYVAVAPLLATGVDPGEIPAGLFRLILACLLVVALFEALQAREAARQLIGLSDPDQPSFVERMRYKHTINAAVIAIGAMLACGLYFLHGVDGIGWLIARGLVWALTIIYVLAVGLLYPAWCQEVRASDESRATSDQQ